MGHISIKNVILLFQIDWYRNCNSDLKLLEDEMNATSIAKASKTLLYIWMLTILEKAGSSPLCIVVY